MLNHATITAVVMVLGFAILCSVIAIYAAEMGRSE